MLKKLVENKAQTIREMMERHNESKEQATLRFQRMEKGVKVAYQREPGLFASVAAWFRDHCTIF